MENLTLSASKREILGKKVKRIRAEGLIPAILYGKDVETQPLAVSLKDFQTLYKQSGASQIVSLIIDKTEPIKVLISEPQRDPVTDKPIHVDFHQVKMTEKIKTEIPLKVIGESAAVKELEGNLILAKDKIEVECLPDALVPEIQVDISKLKTFEDMIHIKDLNIPENITVLDNVGELVAQVTPPRSDEEIQKIEEEAEAAKEKEEEVTEKMEEEAATQAEAKDKTKEGEEAPTPETPTATPAAKEGGGGEKATATSQKEK